MAELPHDAGSCHVCGQPVASDAYRGTNLDPPTEVIELGAKPKFARADQVETDGRIDVQHELSQSDAEGPPPTVRIDFPKPPSAPPPDPAGRAAPFAALISEALGLAPQPISEVVRIDLDEDLRPEELLDPAVAAPQLEFDPISGDALKHRGGRSLGEIEGWLDTGYERPSSEPRPSFPLRPLRASQPPPPRGSQPPPPRSSQPPPPPSSQPPPPPRPSIPDGPLGPPPIRVESLPLADPDRKVRRGAELVLASLEAISDNKLGAAKNHLKLALDFGGDNAAYRSLEAYLVRLEAARDPHVEALEKKAAKLEAEGEIVLAVAALREALATSDEPQLLERLGILIGVKQKRPEVGIRFVERALRLRPKSKDYAQSLERMKKLLPAPVVEAAKPTKKRRGKKDR